MATHTDTPGTPPGGNPRVSTTHYIPTTPPVPTTITRPGKTRRSLAIVLPGTIVGSMRAGAVVHHYRVAGADGVLYLCPPEWLPDDPLGLRNTQFDRMVKLLEELPGLWAARRAFLANPGGWV